MKYYPEVGSTYTHYKGGMYKVLTLAIHTETGEEVVVYQSLSFGAVYVRPLNMWYEKVPSLEDSSRQVLRFSKFNF